MPDAMQCARRIWPILTQLLVATACLAGCHGREPLPVHLHDPLRARERDVTQLDPAEGVPDATVTSAPAHRTPSIDPLPEKSPRPSSAGAGSAGVSGSRPTRPGQGGWGVAAGAGAGADSPWVCGNGVIDPDESCEPTDLGGLTCAALGFEGGGLLLCSSYCSFDVSNCRLQPIDAGQDDDAGVAQP